MFEKALVPIAEAAILALFNKGVTSIKSTQNVSDYSLDRITYELSRLNMQVERLSENIIYVPNLQAVKDTTRKHQNQIQDLREVRAYLDPIQQAFGEDIISSSMITTPEKLHQAMKKSPWDVLINIRPARYAEPSSDISMIPVMFEDDGVTYVGFQKRGILPIMFDCEYDDCKWWQQYEIPNEPRYPSTTEIYIGNLSYRATDKDISKVFAEYGTVRKVYLPKDRSTGCSRGFAFVRMATQNEALVAIQALDRAEWMGRDIWVNFAKAPFMPMS